MHIKKWLKRLSKLRQLKKPTGFRGLEQSGVHHKIGIAFSLTYLVPILLMLYFVELYLPRVAPAEVVSNFRIIFLFTIGAGTLGFWITRRLASSLSQLVKEVEEIVKAGALERKIEIGDKSKEIGPLAKTFNRMVQELEGKVAGLERSKKLIHDLLEKVGAVTTSSRKLDDLLSVIAASMVNSLDAESGGFLLTSRKQDTIELKGACGKDQAKLSELASLNGKGPFDWVIREKKPLLIHNQPGRRHPTMGKNGVAFRSMLCVPLLYHQKLLGLLALVDKKGGEKFNLDDQLLLETVGSQVATVIENAHLNADAERNYFETITALAKAVEAKDRYTRGHLQRVSELVVKLGRAMGLPEDEIQVIKDGALLHDVGKIGIADSILLKPGKLTPEEWKLMKEHTIDGENIIAPLSSFNGLRGIVRGHQEWFNGTGYPDHLKGEEIPLGARILSVADVYDALTTDRPYRKAMSHEVAVQMIRDESGTHFDPKVVKVFLSILDQFRPPSSSDRVSPDPTTSHRAPTRHS